MSRAIKYYWFSGLCAGISMSLFVISLLFHYGKIH